MSTTTPWFIRARLKTRQLMLLTAICDEGNIHRAAEVLNMSQPAASKLLKDLEDMLGVSLFERQPRGMRPNWYGETMIRHARIALSSLREAGQEVDALKAGLSGHVSLGAITGPALSRSARVSNSGTTRIGRNTPDSLSNSCTASTSEAAPAMEIT